MKLQRAEEQLDELEPKIRAYTQGKPFRIADEPDIEDKWMVLRYVDVRELPDPLWGVRIGEFLHDLRSALDNLVYQLVLVNGKEPGDHNQFPIYTDPERPPGLAQKLKRKLPSGATRMDEMLFGVHRDQVAVIKELQPYLGLHIHRGAKIALGSVSTLNNIDKHKIVHPSIAFSQRDGRDAKPTHTAGPPPSDIAIEHRLGPIYEGAEAFRWAIVGGTDETEVAMEGEIPFDVAFGHSPNLTLANFSWIREQISEVVENFAPVFPTNPDRS